MEALFNRLAGIPLIAKVGGLVAVIVVLFGGYYTMFYSDVVYEKENLLKESETLSTEKAEYEKRKVEYLAFRNEVNALLEEQKESQRILPKRADIEQFIESMQSQVELSGLSKVSSVREGAVPVEMYMKIPVRMSLVGTYHQINRFVKNVGDLKRIVNIEDLKLQPDTAAKEAPAGGAPVLKANFIASTFQFVDKAAKKAPAPGAAPAGGTK